MDGRLARQLLRTDSRWQSGLSRRGLGPADVVAVQMGPGTLDTAWTTPGHRYLRVTAALRAGSPDGAPVEGLAALIDLSARRVVDVIDAEPDPPPLDTMPYVIPEDATPAVYELGAGSRSFRIDGHSVTWSGWSFQFALHPREGLVLYQLAHAVDGQRRSIMARAAVAEMLVPYGDATPAWGFAACSTWASSDWGQRLQPSFPVGTCRRAPLASTRCSPTVEGSLEPVVGLSASMSVTADCAGGTERAPNGLASW